MKKYIIGNSSSGKTRQLLEYAKSTGAVVVCQNPDAMRVKAQNYGLFRMDFCGYDEVRCLEEGRDVVIDELGNFFKYNYDVSLDGFNMTSDDLGGV